MKNLAFTLFLLISIISVAIAQNAKNDLDVKGTYHINSIIPLGKFRLWAEISNNSKYDYKDITFKAEFVAGDGTVEGSKNFTLHDYIGPGISKKLKEQYEVCPKDCKSIKLSIVSGKRLN